MQSHWKLAFSQVRSMSQNRFYSVVFPSFSFSFTFRFTPCMQLHADFRLRNRNLEILRNEMEWKGHFVIVMRASTHIVVSIDVRSHWKCTDILPSHQRFESLEFELVQICERYLRLKKINQNNGCSFLRVSSVWTQNLLFTDELEIHSTKHWSDSCFHVVFFFFVLFVCIVVKMFFFFFTSYKNWRGLISIVDDSTSHGFTFYARRIQHKLTRMLLDFVSLAVTVDVDIVSFLSCHFLSFL